MSEKEINEQPRVDLHRRPLPGPEAKQSEGSTVVTLCGSSKWPDLHMKVMMEETLEGRIVIPMGLYGHADFPPGAREITNDGDESTEVKQLLDRLHYRKIDVSHEILVIDPEGYVGSSTKREIDYARTTGKGVRFWSRESDRSSTAGSVVRNERSGPGNGADEPLRTKS